jgi:hypothetical protein
MEVIMNDIIEKVVVRRARLDDIPRMQKIHMICFKPPFPQDINRNRKTSPRLGVWLW